MADPKTLRRRVPLEEVELFRNLAPEQRREIEISGSRRTIRKGAFLFRAEEASQGLHVLLSGRLKSSRFLPGGQEIIMHFVEPGEVFGELPAFLEKPYPSNAQALEECQVFTLPVRAIERLITRQPQVGIRLFRSMARKLAALMERLQATDGSRADERVARKLLTFVEPDGTTQPVLLLKSSKKILARELSIQPESLSRTLRKMTDSGVIEVHGKEIRVLNLQELSRIAARVR